MVFTESYRNLPKATGIPKAKVYLSIILNLCIKDAAWQLNATSKDHASGTTVTSSDGLLTVPNVQQMATNYKAVTTVSLDS